MKPYYEIIQAFYREIGYLPPELVCLILRFHSLKLDIELKTDNFKINWVPGLCSYKFLYVWLDFITPNGVLVKNLGWKYWLPNPLFPFIWFRVAIPKHHPEIEFEEYLLK